MQDAILAERAAEQHGLHMRAEAGHYIYTACRVPIYRGHHIHHSVQDMHSSCGLRDQQEGPPRAVVALVSHASQHCIGARRKLMHDARI